MKFRLLLFVPALTSVYPLPVLADETSRCCYRILVDGKDRSAYQYVNKKLVTFADPSWKQDPAVEEVRLVDVKTGNQERPPFIQRANYISRRPWGGVMFEHIPRGKTLRLRAGGKREHGQGHRGEEERRAQRVARAPLALELLPPHRGRPRPDAHAWASAPRSSRGSPGAGSWL